tara:strand:+ start:197 stop:379 length:183 start_codon:yes stop_codon:yes gene_type:complete
MKIIATAVTVIVTVGCTATKPDNGLLIKDTKGKKHYYELGMTDGRHWCFVHQEYEEVKIK